MNCQNCQMELLENGRCSAEAQSHLDSCPECQAFAAALELAVPPVPAPELDFQVLEACRGALAARRRLRRNARARRLLAGIAAVLAIVLSVIVLNLAPSTPNAPAPAPRPLAANLSGGADGEYTDALSWDVGVSLSTAELDQVEMDLEFLLAGL